MATAREEIISIYDTVPARYNTGFSEIEVEPEPFAEGTFGSIHRGRWGGRAVAVEKFDLDNTDDNFNRASKEMSRMIRLRHQNVLKVYGFYFVAEGLVLKCFMVMELMEFDLDKYIEQWRGRLLLNDDDVIHNRAINWVCVSTDDEVFYIMAEIARGMKRVYESGYSHGDLKPQNVLMRRSAVLTDSRLDVKVADYGSSELMSAGQLDRTAGTSWYKAPEQSNRHAFNLQPYKMDVYSFGCMCFKLWTGKHPPEEKQWGAWDFIDLPSDVERIIKECMDIDPNARPGFSKISAAFDAVLNKWPSFRFARIMAQAQSGSVEKRQDPVERRREIVEKLGLGRGGDGLNYEDLVILPEELRIRRPLAGGSEAMVYEVEWRSSRCVLKRCARSGLEGGKWKGTECVDFFGDFDLSWFKMLPTLIHKNIVRFIGYSFRMSQSEQEVSSWILIELLACDLSAYLKLGQPHPSTESLSNETKWKILKGIAEGMKFLHDKDWVHGDLKPANVVVDDADDIVVKLIDFNIMRYAASDVPEHTTRYAAPEVLQARSNEDLRGRIDYKKSDVYSFAITCSDILGEDEDYGLLVHPSKFIVQVKAGIRPVLPKETSEDVKDLISRCWSYEPFSRPSFGDICEFFSRPMPVQLREVPSRPMPLELCVVPSGPKPEKHCCKLL